MRGEKDSRLQWTGELSERGEVEERKVEESKVMLAIGPNLTLFPPVQKKLHAAANRVIRCSPSVVSTKNRQVPVNRESLTLFRNLEYRCAGFGMERDGGVWGISLERFAETCRNQNRYSSGMRMFGKERPP